MQVDKIIICRWRENGNQIIDPILSTGLQNCSDNRSGPGEEEEPVGDTRRLSRVCQGNDRIHVQWETPHHQHR